MKPDAHSDDTCDDSGALDRSGHLSELALDRHRSEPDAPRFFRRVVEEHLAACEACSRALSQLVAEDAHLSVVPRPPVVAGVVPLRWRRTGLLAVPVLAVAAIALLVTPPAPQPVAEGFRRKGAGFELEVHVHDGLSSRRVTDGEVVHPGERMAFSVRASAPGHILILGRDDRGETYLCHPTTGPSTAPLAASTDLSPLGTALAFDDVLGVERVVAFHCDAPLTLPDLAVPEETPQGCVRREVALRKVPR